MTTLNAEEVWRLFTETDRRFQQTDRKFQETDRKFQETDRLIKELGRQIGGLGNKFGSFTEGLALPSMERLLRERFKMTVISPRVKVQLDGREMEIDVLAYANGSIHSAYVVEVKSHLDERALEQTLEILKQFPRMFPEHADKALYGILAYVQGSREMRQRVLEAGLLPATIHDEQFRLEAPEGFQPRRFDTQG
jgi:hypothetical protein